MRYFIYSISQKLNLTSLLFLVLFGALVGCKSDGKSSETTRVEPEKEVYAEKTTENDDSIQKGHRRRHKGHLKKQDFQEENANDSPENRTDKSDKTIGSGNVPTKALKVLKYVRENGVAIEGYVGGRKFGNYEGLLPKKDGSGKRVNYQEWDVNPKTEGKNRGKQRLITGSDGKAYYTGDHYGSFVEIK
jgi:ribonuclease T1